MIAANGTEMVPPLSSNFNRHILICSGRKCAFSDDFSVM